MKTNFLIILLGLSIAGFAQKKSELLASKSIGKVLVKGKKTYTYNALSEKAKTEFKVSGPGILHINTRVRLPEDQFSSQPFRIKCVRSDEHISFFDIPELLASNLKFNGTSLSGVPSRHFRYTINVPPGKHTYRFYKDKTDQKVSVRLFYEEHLKPKWFDLEPMTALEDIKLRYLKSGKERSYKKLSKNQSFLFAVSDTTRLRILLRPEFTYRMLEETVLKVKLVNTKTGEETVYRVDAKKSRIMEYVDVNDKIPGTLNTIYLDLPSQGANVTYDLSLVGGTKVVAVRISKDLNIESDPLP